MAEEPRKAFPEEDPHGDRRRDDPIYGPDSPSERGGDQSAPPVSDHDGAPRDESSDAPLGPVTPDRERPLGDTTEAHDEITPYDLPPDHPARKAAERQAGRHGGTTRGNS